MSRRTYDGAWRRGQTEPARLAGGYGRPPADPVDATHGTPPEDLGLDAAQVHGPAIAGVDDAILGAVVYGVGTPGVIDAPIDRTPIDHAQGLTASATATDAEATAEANAARSRDLGAPRARQYAPRAGRGAGEEFVTERREVLPVNAGSMNQVRLQVTSRPENTVDSRNGFEVFRWVERKFGYRWRTPDMRPTRISGAAVAVDSPPLRDANAYVSPFATLASGRTRTQMRPMIRRVPRPWDEELVTDGTGGPESPYEFQSWGL